MPHPYFIDAPAPRVLAHRGFVPDALTAQGIAENTRAAFQAAKDAGAVFVESDCHLTSDGHIVLFHDDNLLRVAGDPRRVADVTHRELAQIMRDRGELLTLSEALEEFPDTRFNIDVKADCAAGLTGVAVAEHCARVLLTSFSDEIRLRALRAAAAVSGGERPATSAGRGTIVQLLLAAAIRSQRRAGRLLSGIDALQIPERQGPVRVFTPWLVEMAHRFGVEVHVWTINDPGTMRQLVARGADGIVTDRADLALDALQPSLG